jgi:hypothetical protein
MTISKQRTPFVSDKAYRTYRYQYFKTKNKRLKPDRFRKFNDRTPYQFKEGELESISEKIDRFHRGYLAGMWEGDGRISYRKRGKSKTFDIKLKLIDLNIIEWVADIFGIAITQLEYEHPKRQDQYYCYFRTDERAYQFLLEVAPYLFEKKAIAEEMLLKKFKNYPCYHMKRPFHNRHEDVVEMFGFICGFFDAEGSWGVYVNYTNKKKTKHSIAQRIKFTNSSTGPLLAIQDYLKNMFSIKSYLVKRIRNTFDKQMVRHKPVHDLCIRVEDVKKFVRIFGPYIKIDRKKEKISQFESLFAIDRYFKKKKEKKNGSKK